MSDSTSSELAWRDTARDRFAPDAVPGRDGDGVALADVDTLLSRNKAFCSASFFSLAASCRVSSSGSSDRAGWLRGFGSSVPSSKPSNDHTRA